MVEAMVVKILAAIAQRLDASPYHSLPWLIALVTVSLSLCWRQI